MAKIETEIKNLINSHLRGELFGMEIYGQHEKVIFDGKQDRSLVIVVRGASRFERYGTVTVYHPNFGKWQATLLSENHCGKPHLIMSLEDVRAEIARIPAQDFAYRVFGGEKPDGTIEENQSRLIAEAVKRGLFGES